MRRVLVFGLLVLGALLAGCVVAPGDGARGPYDPYYDGPPPPNGYGPGWYYEYDRYGRRHRYWNDGRHWNDRRHWNGTHRQQPPPPPDPPPRQDDARPPVRGPSHDADSGRGPVDDPSPPPTPDYSRGWGKIPPGALPPP